MQKLRIYGDNILECEKTLDLIYKSIKINTVNSTIILKFDFKSNIFCPLYIIQSSNDNKGLFEIQLFAGYNRWTSNILDKLTSLGSSLNEGADSIVTQLMDDREEILFGCEYCGALPAGNNAWQRSGRALLFAEAKIPFLYYSEIGGMELDSDRKLKSGRLPNPLVPFSYITANINYEDSIIAPIYIPSPTISDNNLDLYKNCFINDEDLNIIYGLITGNKEIYLLNSKYIRNKSLEITKLLIDNRRIKDTLTSEQLFMLLDLIMKSSSKLLFEKDIMKWSKSITINLTDSMENIFKYCKNYCYAMGSKTLPFCLIPEDKKNEFISLLDSIYKDKNIIDKIKNSKKPIALVWIAGFKPRGDDSRPDRGLLPLFKMLFGDEYTVLSLIFGPMKNTAINTLINNPHKLINSNGLWKSLYTQSDYIIVDNYISGTSDLGLCKIFGTNTYTIASNNIIYNPCSTIPKLGEDDIDTIIHSIFRTFFNNNFSSDTTFIYESLCNPPGGDWSGIEFLDITRNILFRWSSLPRVSGEDKRPDHIVQFKDKFLIVESKLYKRNLECNIGPRLKNYVRKLVNIPAIAYKNYPLGNWTLNNNTIANTYNYDYLSAIAFLKNNKTHDIYYSNTKENTFFDYNEEYYSELFNLTNTDIIFEITIYSNTVLIDISSRNEMVKNWVENMVKYNKNIVSLKNSKNIYINIF